MSKSLLWRLLISIVGIILICVYLIDTDKRSHDTLSLSSIEEKSNSGKSEKKADIQAGNIGINKKIMLPDGLGENPFQRNISSFLARKDKNLKFDYSITRNDLTILELMSNPNSSIRYFFSLEPKVPYFEMLEILAAGDITKEEFSQIIKDIEDSRNQDEIFPHSIRIDHVQFSYPQRLEKIEVWMKVLGLPEEVRRLTAEEYNFDFTVLTWRLEHLIVYLETQDISMSKGGLVALIIYPTSNAEDPFAAYPVRDRLVIPPGVVCPGIVVDRDLFDNIKECIESSERNH